MSLMIKSIEQSTADMLKAEKERFLKTLLEDGIITTEEYSVLRKEII